VSPVHAEVGNLANGHAAEPLGFAEPVESWQTVKQQPEGDFAVELREGAPRQ
jgi:hypothetical protein